MGKCMGRNKLPENVFHWTSISDDKRMMQVMEVELIDTDRQTTTSWRCPLNLRKYDYDGGVFPFEAMRKCPG